MTRLAVESERYVWELDLSAIEGCVVIVDIDGTLAAFDHCSVASEATQVLQTLRAKNDVFLFSNNANRGRLARLAQEHNVSHISSLRRKPDPRIARDIPPSRHSRRVVIGDRAMTDGLFAYFIGARFIKVRRARSGAESVFRRALYWADDALFSLVRAIKRFT